MDEADSETADLVRVAQLDALAVDGEVARVRLMNPGEDLDERGLARAVLARQRMYAPRCDSERRRVERELPAEALRDPSGLQDGGPTLVFRHRLPLTAVVLQGRRTGLHETKVRTPPPSETTV
ncbi:MAG: hypothetical protein U0S48_10285 [Solirubrobacteraceae bacterium]